MNFFHPTILIILCFFVACSQRDEIVVNIKKYDEFFGLQWHLQDTNDFSINIAPAWEITKGRGVKVAVLDEDIQKYHEEFENIEVYNIVNKSNSCEPVNRGVYSHGTAVTGVVGARKNVVGTIGVAPECNLLFIGGSSTYFFSDASLIEAFEYAKNWGADVINCSWGTYNVSPALESMLEYLYKRGTVIVFATGNERRNLDTYKTTDESELPWVIGVSSSNEYGFLSNSSDYGKAIDIMACGERILAPDLMGAEGSNNHYGEANDNYGYRNGTSFSAPIVSGVAALMFAVNPTLTPYEVRRIITETAKKTGDKSMYGESGFSLRHAYGLIDAGEAVKRAAGVNYKNE